MFRYPWSQWVFCFIILICNIYLSYIIYYYRIRTPWTFGANIIIYWITFFVLYISEIQKLTEKHSKKQVNLSFDEWNVWYHSNEQDKEIWKRDKWNRALPLLEDVYNFEDALLVGSMLMTLIRNADRVRIACLAQLVNVIAPIMTRNGGGCWAQTTYYPFMHVSRYGRGTALQALVDSPLYDCADYEGVPYIDSAAVLADNGDLTIFCVNRDMEEDFELSIDLRSFDSLKLEEHILLHSDDVKAVNTEADPYHVIPTDGPGGTITDGKASVHIPALSWNVLRFCRDV